MLGDSLSRFERSFEEGEYLLREGDYGDFFYLIRKGKVEITKQSGDTDYRLARLGAGDMIGELILVRDGGRTASAVALTKVEGWKLNKKQYENLLDNNEKFRHHVIEKLSSRLANTTEKLDEYRQLEHVLQRIGLLVLDQVDPANLIEGEPVDTEVSLDPNDVAHAYDISPELVWTLVDTLEFDNYARQDLETRERLQAATRRLLTRTSEEVNLEPDVPSRDLDLSENPVEMLQDLERIMEHVDVDNPEAELNQKLYDNLMSDLTHLEKFQEEWSQAVEDPSDLLVHFQKELDAARRILNDVQRGNLEELE